MERSATADPSSQQLTLESGMGSNKVGIFTMAVRPLSKCLYFLYHEKWLYPLDQQYAHERILYEENLRSLQGKKKQFNGSYLPKCRI